MFMIDKEYDDEILAAGFLSMIILIICILAYYENNHESLPSREGIKGWVAL